MAKLDEAAASYWQLLKPKLESQRANMDPIRNPVQVAMLDRYRELMEVLFIVGGDTQDFDDFNELAPWVMPRREASADRAHGGPLGQIMQSVGYGYSETYPELEEARKRPRGRPVALRSVEALEMHLVGKRDEEIADVLCDYPEAQHRPHKNGDTCSERVRKARENLSTLYEKCKRPRK